MNKVVTCDQQNDPSVIVDSVTGVSAKNEYLTKIRFVLSTTPNLHSH
jgi:hypothetical protein